MRFFKSFRLLHRRTKSDGDVAVVLAAQSAARITPHALPVHRLSANHPGLGNFSFGESSLFIDDISFAPPTENTLPLFDANDLFSPFSYDTAPRISGSPFDSGIIELESELATLREANRTLKADLVEITKEAADARNTLYAHMTKSAHQEQRAAADAERIKNYMVEFARYKSIDGLLARIGLHKVVLNDALAVLEAGGNPADVVVNAIKLANAKTTETTTAKHSSPVGPRSPEQYVATLNMTLNVRKELKGNKKITKFWKRIAQEDGRNGDIITPSPSDVSSIYEPLSAERQKALDALVARRREAVTISESKSASSISDSATQLSVLATVNNPPMPASESASSTMSTVRSTLPPLASDSLKRELAQHSTNRRFAGSRSSSRPSVLRAIDPNVPAPKRATAPRLAGSQRNVPVAPAPLPHRRYPSAASDASSVNITKKKTRSDTTRSFVAALSASLRKSRSARKAAKRKSNNDVENSVPFDNTAFQPEIASSVSDPAASSQDPRPDEVGTPVQGRSSYEHGGSLGHISEESADSIYDDTEGETSFATHATPTTGPTTPSKTPNLSAKTPEASPTAMKSKLPVLKYIRRLSLSSPPKPKVRRHVDAASPSKLPRRVGAWSAFPAVSPQRVAVIGSTRRR